ncbi:MAG: nonstructural protein [Microvirus sp.]|nr:MAG: nonstructural protein [Microvirus sp.]
MKFFVIAIRDMVAEAYSVPQFVVNIGASVRGFGDEIRRAKPDHNPAPLQDHPEDFNMYLLGEYEDSAGVFELHAPSLIAQGRDYKEVK